MEARVVDLPDPVAPTTRTRPRFSITSCRSTGGRLRSSSFGMSALTKRMTEATEPFCQKTFTRKLPRPIIGLERFSSSSFSNVAVCAGESIS